MEPLLSSRVLLEATLEMMPNISRDGASNLRNAAKVCEAASFAPYLYAIPPGPRMNIQGFHGDFLQRLDGEALALGEAIFDKLLHARKYGVSVGGRILYADMPVGGQVTSPMDCQFADLVIDLTKDARTLLLNSLSEFVKKTAKQSRAGWW